MRLDVAFLTSKQHVVYQMPWAPLDIKTIFDRTCSFLFQQQDSSPRDRKPLILKIKKLKKKPSQPQQLTKEKGTGDKNEIKPKIENPGKENFTKKSETMVIIQKQQPHQQDFVNMQCKHSDGFVIRENLHTETGVGKVAVTLVPPSSHKSGKDQKKSSKVNNKPNTGKSDDNDLVSQNRYAMEFPRHNWLLERLVSENKIDGQEVKQQERKLNERMDKEKEYKEKENLELEKLNKERRKMQRLEKIRQKQQQQQQYENNQSLTNRTDAEKIRARSDSEIDIISPEAKSGSLKRSLSSSDVLSNDSLNIKILNVVSLSSRPTEDLTTKTSPEKWPTCEKTSPMRIVSRETVLSKASESPSNDTETLESPITGSNNHATVFKPKIILHQTENELCQIKEKSNPFLKQKALNAVDDLNDKTINIEEEPKEEIVDVLSIDDDTPSAFKKSYKTTTSDVIEEATMDEDRLSLELVNPKTVSLERVSPSTNPDLPAMLHFPPKPSVRNMSSFTYQRSFTLPTQQPVPRLPIYMQTSPNNGIASSTSYKNNIRFANSIMESYRHDRRRYPMHRAAEKWPSSYSQRYQSSSYYERERLSSVRNMRIIEPSLRSPVASKNSFLMELQRKHDEEYIIPQVRTYLLKEKIFVYNLLAIL